MIMFNKKMWAEEVWNPQTKVIANFDQGYKHGFVTEVYDNSEFRELAMQYVQQGKVAETNQPYCRSFLEIYPDLQKFPLYLKNPLLYLAL